LMLETIRKKASNRNEMSDMEPVLSPGVFLAIVLYFLSVLRIVLSLAFTLASIR
jgi:hypothetical protein